MGECVMRTRSKRSRRRGAVLVLVAILLVVILGMVACAFDIGWILMTRTQLQAAADSAALAAGTELLPGLGYQPTRTPSQVISAGTPVAQHYASLHRNGDVASSYADATRDVQYFWAKFTPHASPPGAGTWALSSDGQTGTGWYNAVRVTLHRDQADSTNSDTPLPLILAPVLGSTTSDVSARATAIIMPAKGFTIEPGSNEYAHLIPFALYQDFWEKYWRAQRYLENPDNVVAFNDLVALQKIVDPAHPYDPLVDPYPWEPLFGEFEPAQNKADDKADGVEDGLAFRQLFTDNWSSPAGLDPDYGLPQGGDPPVPDGILEMDAYPHRYSSGNFGTIDLGWAGNSTDTLSRQIVDGINETDLEYLGIEPGEEFTLEAVNNTVTGDTGISVGIKDDIWAIRGQCRAMLLFSNVAEPGNNAQFTLTDFVGVRIMDVQLTGAEEYKNITIQLCKFSMPGAVADLEDEIGPETTVFTPLMLIE